MVVVIRGSDLASGGLGGTCMARAATFTTREMSLLMEYGFWAVGSILPFCSIFPFHSMGGKGNEIQGPYYNMVILELQNPSTSLDAAINLVTSFNVCVSSFIAW